MKRMPKIEAQAHRLLSPNETLDVRLFDFGGQMHPEVRKKLLDNATYVVGRTIGELDGLKVHDIFLTGSSSGYFYHTYSDIDLRIEVHNENCQFLTKDIKELNHFLSVICHGALAGYKFCLDNRFVDTKINANTFEILNLYSVLHDKWVIMPNQHIADEVDVTDVINAFYRKYEEVEKYLRNFQNRKAAGLAFEQIKALQYYREEIIENANNSVPQYIVYKLLNYAGVMRKLNEIISTEYKNYFTLI